ncbi:MAG: DUF3352 domain-containing protein [Cyanobacterium sp. T60_A2020_053]|nr:DUF3352 domain-containing protein [Cyanobacterium sp. T60_A2020_053]
MKKFLPIVVAFVLIAITALVFINQTFNNYLASGGVKKNPDSTIFISRQSPFMVSLLVNPEKINLLPNFLPTKSDQKKVLQAVEQIRTKLLNKVKIDDPEALKDWLGDEITLAVTSLDLDHNRDNGVQTGYLLVVKNNNPSLAREFLRDYYAKQAVSTEAKLIFDTYQGVNLIYQKPKTADIPQVAAAVIANYTLFANDLLVLKDAINNAQAINLNLSHYQPYGRALETITQPKVSLAYLNLPATSAWITSQPLPENQPIEQNLIISLAVSENGLIAHSALSGVTGNENQPPALNHPPSALQYIPDDSIFATSGVNLQGLWALIKQGLPENSPLQQLITQSLKPLQSSLNLNFAEDVFPLVTGEYGLSLSIDKMTQELDWLFVNENLGQSLGENFDLIAQNRGLSVGKLPLENTTITAWTKLVTTAENNFAKLEAQVKGVHTQKDTYEIITNSVDTLSDLLAEPEKNLLNNEIFKETIADMPVENNGYFYLQWQEIEPYLIKEFPILKVAKLSFKPLFDNLKSLTITSEGTENGVTQATIFLDLLK